MIEKVWSLQDSHTEISELWPSQTVKQSNPLSSWTKPGKYLWEWMRRPDEVNRREGTHQVHTVCRKGKAQFSVSLVDNAERQEEVRLKTSLVNIFTVREKNLLLPRTFVMICRTCYKWHIGRRHGQARFLTSKSWESAEKYQKLILKNQKEKTKKRSRVEVAQTTVRLFVCWGWSRVKRGRKREGFMLHDFIGPHCNAYEVLEISY